jgi:hypothetical protein
MWEEGRSCTDVATFCISCCVGWSYATVCWLSERPRGGGEGTAVEGRRRECKETCTRADVEVVCLDADSNAAVGLMVLLVLRNEVKDGRCLLAYAMPRWCDGVWHSAKQWTPT